MGKTKAYYRRKNKENYEKNKKLSKEYHASSFITETFTEFKKRKK